MSETKKMLHIALSNDQISKYVFLPGSPERVPRIAAYMDNAKKIAQNREHTTYEGYINGIRVLVTSTGMGGPSAIICLEELSKLGADTFIRIGTCASVSPKVRRGDIVIPNGAVRMEGTSSHFLPMEYPAVPDYFLVRKLEAAAIELGYRYNVGVSITKDSFYTQMEPETRPIGPELKFRWDSYEKGGATSTSMECAPLFIAGGSLGVRVATVMVSAANYKNYSNDDKDYPADTEKLAIITGIEGMKKVIEEDRINGII